MGLVGRVGRVSLVGRAGGPGRPGQSLENQVVNRSQGGDSHLMVVVGLFLESSRATPAPLWPQRGGAATATGAETWRLASRTLLRRR